MVSVSPVLFLVVFVAFQPSGAAGNGRDIPVASVAAQAANGERAKAGLLPRRATRSRVMYLSGSAASGKDAMPLSAALAGEPVTLLAEEVEEDGSTAQGYPGVVAVADSATPTEAPESTASGVEVTTAAVDGSAGTVLPGVPTVDTSAESTAADALERPGLNGRTGPAAAASVATGSPAKAATAPAAAPVATSNASAAVTAPAAGSAPAETASEASAAASFSAPAMVKAPVMASTRDAPPSEAEPAAPAQAAAGAVVERGAGPVPVPAAAAESPGAFAVRVERTIDQAGEVVVRATGPDAHVLWERMVCPLADMPVLYSKRAGDGSVLQTIEDEWGIIEVHRDAVGRFLSARPIEGRVVAD
ncbi:MAG TPA: hypothetical protein VFG59_10780 [Anaeromyxobacter sp.]|nr:hypothetical protein [Anaeromyxobacter sp.]